MNEKQPSVERQLGAIGANVEILLELQKEHMERAQAMAAEITELKVSQATHNERLGVLERWRNWILAGIVASPGVWQAAPSLLP